MSAPLPVDLSAIGAPCPACGVPLLLDDKRTTCCPACAAVVGTPGRFVDEKSRRKPLRPAFSTGPLRPCGRCQQALQRVLVDDVGGCFCAGCNLVFVADGQVPRLLNKEGASRLRVQTERPRRDGLRPRDWLAIAVALCAVGVIAAVEMGLV
jgi:hypothetical protein